MRQNLLSAGSYELPHDHYDKLCAVRDKLLLMVTLAGTHTSNGDHDALLFIRRSLIGQLFRDRSFQVDDVLEDVAKTIACVDYTQAH